MALCGSWSYSSPPIFPSKSQSVNLWAHRNREPPKTWIRLRETNPRHSRANGTHKQDTEYLALRARFVPQNPSPLERASVPFVASAAWSRADQNPPLASTRTVCLHDDEDDNDDNSDDDRCRCSHPPSEIFAEEYRGTSVETSGWGLGCQSGFETVSKCFPFKRRKRNLLQPVQRLLLVAQIVRHSARDPRARRSVQVIHSLKCHSNFLRVLIDLKMFSELEWPSAASQCQSQFKCTGPKC